MKARMKHWLTGGIVAGGILVAGAPASAVVFNFSGSDEGGTGSATMDIQIAGNVLTATLDNTSPTTLDSGSGDNAPGITGFGFNLSDPAPTLTSWTLTAFEWNGTTLVGPVTIGDDTGAGEWELGTTLAAITLDFLPQIDGIDGALYNPDAVESSLIPGGQNASYFTQAVLTLNFDSTPVLDLSPVIQGEENFNPFVRFQNVGLDGEGSLRLGPGDGDDDGDDDLDDGGGQDEPPIPEPATALLGVMGMGLLAMRRTRR